jgi:hypothetical protein|tara:strand:- start:246 stop:503 length:258 start_codon:yes stop_codon:yes gene_type:complete
MTPEQTELTQYLADAIKQVKVLEGKVATRNKTKKFKAIAAILIIVKGRVNATYQYVKAGGHSDFSVIIQRQMYDPIIQWLAGEIA